jgi:hypothetical protein
MSEEQTTVPEQKSFFVFGSDMHFNTVVYACMRAIHLPMFEGGQELPLVDTWFAIAAIQHGPMVSLVNNNVELSALMIIDAAGRTVKAHRVNTLTAPVLEGFELNKVKAESFDIPLWEKTHNKPFPYETMFDKFAMTRRFNEVGATASSIMGIESNNETYNAIRKRVQPRPCTTCGGKNKR